MASSIAKVEKGTLHFRWEGNGKVSLACVVNESGEIEHDPFTVQGMDGKLESVTVEMQDGSEETVCLECQTHLIKSRMIECPEGSSNLEEVQVCTNPDCPNTV